MAKAAADIASQCRKIIQDAENGIFAPVYLLMGEEPYYPDLVCEAVMKHALSDMERDFNQTVWYGIDTDALTVASEARAYPMMADRRLVVVKEAQNLQGIEDLALYCEDPMETTVLVVLLHGSSVDKRKAFYKNASKKGVVVDSPAIKDYKMAEWVSSYYAGRGLTIDPDAAALMAEYTGTDLSKVAAETEKMLRNLPEGASRVTASDVERNVGISKQYTVFELSKALSFKDRARSLKIASYIGNTARFYLPMAISGLFTSFYRILKYEILLMKNPRPTPAEKTAALGVAPYFFAEYDRAVVNYPFKKTLGVLSLLEEYDFKAKGGGGEADPGQLLVELVAKILNV